MRLVRSLVVLGAVVTLGFIASCTSARVRLVEWRNSEMTLCYPDKLENSDWIHESTKFCNGSTSLVGGESRDRLSGYEAQRDGDKVKYAPRVREESCRIFQCNGTISPES